MLPENNAEHLLSHYRLIWNNRRLESVGDNAQEVLHEAIKRELLDENSHPRIRKPLYEKFYSAIKRINDSILSAEVKNELITLHIDIIEQIKLNTNF